LSISKLAICSIAKLQNCYHQKHSFLAQNASQADCGLASSARTRWGSLQRSLRPLAGLKSGPSGKGRGKGRKGRDGVGGMGRGRVEAEGSPFHSPPFKGGEGWGGKE